MRMYDVIKKKRDGDKLSAAEIEYFVEGYTDGSIPDYQAAAFCMAIRLRGMDAEETAALTLAIRDSGDILKLAPTGGLRVDKHSTGGVGDKTSLAVIPIVAALGVKVAKMSGRGLGHTGGTVDKLEAFEGFRTDLSTAEFEAVVERCGLSIVGQSANLAPADKKLYALRDVTATVDSLPLIASSIMGKKLAADDDCIVLDVKTGSGSFMKTVEDSIELARLMVDIGKRAGKRMSALITDMDRPLGRTVGNTVEVVEAIETLCGRGPEDFTELCVALATEMLVLAERGDRESCRASVLRVIESGEALEKLADMVEAQGGNRTWVTNPEKFPRAAYSHTVRALSSGYITRVNAEDYGKAALLLGAGRNTKEDEIDHKAGLRLFAKTGDYVNAGEPIAELYASDPRLFAAAEQTLLQATELGPTQPAPRPLIFDVIN